MNKPKKRNQPYLNLDGSYGSFEKEFLEYYEKQTSSNLCMKQIVAVGFGIQKLNPLLFSMIESVARNQTITQEQLAQFVHVTSGITAPLRVEVKQPELVEEPTQVKNTGDLTQFS